MVNSTYKQSSTWLVLILVFILNSANSFGQVFTDSNLPIVIITTDINPDTNQPFEIPDDPRVLATMKIIKRSDGTRNYLTDEGTTAYLNYNGRINIEIRGSSSQDLPKKQYGLTTLQANNTSNNNVSLLGMPSENDWILNGLAFDPSLIRDYLSYNVTRQIGDYAPRTEYCEVVINGDYKGLYILQEKIKADTNRVNVVKITASDNSAPNVTGGYITKADKTTGGDPVAWTMSSYNEPVDYIHELPKPEEVTATQNEYIHNRFEDLATTTGDNNSSIITGYPSVIDVPTFVDYMLVNELASNADAYQISTFFHKDRNGKLRAGPVWDHNLTYGNDLFAYGLDRSHFDVWQFNNDDNTGPKFWKDLFDNAEFKCYLSRRFAELTQTDQPMRHNSLVEFIDNTVTYISEAIVREQQRWGTVPNHALEIENLKSFLYQRINWMTTNLGSFSACATVEVPSLVITKINYNPPTDAPFTVSNDQEFIEIKNIGQTAIDATGIYFRELGISYQFPAASSIGAGQSIFLASTPTTFLAKYGITAFGQFTRNLSNSTQNLVLADAFGNIIDAVKYTDSAPWPNADGNGSFLELSDTSLDNSLASSWVASNATTLLSVNAFNDGIAVVLYPNPVNSLLKVRSESMILTISITDVYGKLLYTTPVYSNEASVDFSDYSTGIYFTTLSSATGAQTQKIIKQ